MKKNLLCKYKTKKAFTLIEILVAILILSSVLILWFQLYTKALASKVKIDEQANLEKNIYYFSERLFQLIKKGWTLDYEEYWARRLKESDFYSEYIFSNPPIDFQFKNWHYENLTWFWNYWKDLSNLWNYFGGWFYYCLSDTNNIPYLSKKENWEYKDKFALRYWCSWHNNVNDKIKSKIVPTADYYPSSDFQRYWQYSFQFIDYNSNWDKDNWDEDDNWNIIWDDDDKHLWKWPEVFDSGSDVKELYLLSWDKKTRTFFRWYIDQDEHIKDYTKKCDYSLKKENLNWIPQNPVEFQYCRWTIQFLQLEGKDWWMDHNSNNIDDDKTQNDWVVDTWVIASNFSWKSNSDSDLKNTVIAWTSEDEKYWKELFSDSINISDFKVFAYPNIDSSKVWDINEVEQKKYKISPYVILSFEVKPSWKVKAKISWWEIKPIRFNTTINLTDIFSK